MAAPNKTTTRARDAQAIAGIQKHLPSASSVPLAGSTYSPADLVKLIQNRMDTIAKADAIKATWHSTVLAGEAQNTQLTPILRALRQHVINVYGAASPVLADFGFAPPKTTARTPEAKAAAAAKSKATRAARHTMGKNQKKAVKGNVTGIVVTPTTSAEASPPIRSSPIE